MLFFPFWSWLRPRPCQIFFESSLRHFLHCAEALTSSQEWQPHVAFNAWALQCTADLLFVKSAPRRKQKSHGLASGKPRMGSSLLCSSGLSSVWLPAIHLFQQEISLHIQALLDACLISSLLFCSLMGQEVKSQRREVLFWSGSPQKLRAARRRNSVIFMALLSSVRSVVIPLLQSGNYFINKMRCSHFLPWHCHCKYVSQKCIPERVGPVYKRRSGFLKQWKSCSLHQFIIFNRYFFMGEKQMVCHTHLLSRVTSSCLTKVAQFRQRTQLRPVIHLFI